MKIKSLLAVILVAAISIAASAPLNPPTTNLQEAEDSALNLSFQFAAYPDAAAYFAGRAEAFAEIRADINAGVTVVAQ